MLLEHLSMGLARHQSCSRGAWQGRIVVQGGSPLCPGRGHRGRGRAEDKPGMAVVRVVCRGWFPARLRLLRTGVPVSIVVSIAIAAPPLHSHLILDLPEAYGR